MAAVTKYALAATGSTGNVTGSGVELTNVVEQGQVGFQFVVEAIGATPTITFKYQGSLDNVNWYDVIYYTDANDTLAVATRVSTTVSAVVQWLDTGNGSRLYRYYRVVPTANTNVTYRAELYAFNVPR